MVIPTPGQLKKQLDEKKSTESSTPEESTVSPSPKKVSAASNSPKKPFVMPEHLTQKPFSMHPELKNLRAEMAKSEPVKIKKVKKPISSKRAMQANTSYGKKPNKENN